MMKKFLPLVLISLLTSVSLQAGQRLSFSHFGADRGFPQIGISGFCQDDKGNIWISSGENGGLFKYDGYELTRIFKGSVLALESGSDGRIYFSDATRFFSNDGEIDSPFAPSIICEFDKGRILLVKEYKACIFDIRTGSFTNLDLFSKLSITTSICKFDAHRVIAGSNAGDIYEIDVDSGEVKKCCSIGAKVNAVDRDSIGRIWAATWDNGLICYDSNSGNVTSYRKGNSDSSLSSDILWSLGFQNDSTLWIGTNDGLDILHTDSGIVDRYFHSLDDRTSISHNVINSIMKDNQGGMWLGTYYGGVNYWNPSSTKIQNILGRTSRYSLNDNIVNRIVEDRNSNIWIGTNRGGINKFNPSTGEIEHFLIGQESAEYNDVKAILPIPGSTKLYVGTFLPGLSILDEATGRFKTIEGMNGICDLLRYRDGVILAATIHGVYAVDEKTFKREKLLASGMSRVLFKDSRNKIWVSTSTRLISFSLDDSLSLLDVQSLPDIISVTSFLETNDNKLWICSEFGLYLYDMNINSIIDFPGSDFFKSLYINGMEMDKNGDLWLGAANGLYRFSPQNGRIVKYTTSDGFATDYYGIGSHMKCSDGSLYFGGLGGISHFFPEDVEPDLKCPEPIVSRVFAHDEELEFNRDDVLNLSYTQSHVSFLVSTPDFIAEGSNEFEYMLKGFDNRWYHCGNDRMAVYAKLPKGTYTLKIRVSRDGIIWQENPKAITVRMHPVWYKTTLAIVIEITVLILLILAALNFTIRQKDLKNQVKLMKLEKKYESEIKKLKVFKVLNSPLKNNQGKNTPITELNHDQEIFLTTAYGIVEENISNSEFSVDDFAKAMGISVKTLYSKMKAYTNGTALDFLHTIRFSKACEMLEDGKLNISEIAYNVGFSSVSYFSDSFKKHTGISPQTYRNTFNDR